MAIGDVMVAKDTITSNFTLKQVYYMKTKWNSSENREEKETISCLIMYPSSPVQTPVNTTLSGTKSKLELPGENVTADFNSNGIFNLEEDSVTLNFYEYGSSEEFYMGEDLTANSNFSYNYTQENGDDY